MRAGSLKYRVKLLKPIYTVDQYGSSMTGEYEEKLTVHAERVAPSAFRTDENGEHFADGRVQFNIRHNHNVSENWRCKLLGGDLYTIVGIVPNLDRGYKTLICEKVNE